MARKIQHHFPDSISLCVRPAGTGSQLTRTDSSQSTRTASCALYQHPILRNHTIYVWHYNNIIYNSISGLLDYFTGRLHNNFIIHQTHVCSRQEYTSDWIIPPVTAGGRHLSGGSLPQRSREVAMFLIQRHVTHFEQLFQYQRPRNNKILLYCNCMVNEISR